MDRSILDKASALQQEFRKVESRETLWNTTVMQLIKDQLEVFAKADHGLGCFVQASVIRGEAFVQLQLRNQATANNPDQHRRGGILSYNLKYNGKVLVIIAFPYIKGQVQQIPPITVGESSIEPEEINKELIWGHIDVFLEKMSHWQSGNLVSLGLKTSTFWKGDGSWASVGGDKVLITDDPRGDV
jgi:hypothetical protein